MFRFPWNGSFPLKHLNPSKMQTGVTLEYTPNITDIFNNKCLPTNMAILAFMSFYCELNIVKINTFFYVKA